MPLATIAERAARAAAGGASRRGPSAAGRRHGHRRQLQREPDGDEARAGRARERAGDAAGGGARRDARARRPRRRPARRGRAARPRRPASTCCSPSAARRRRRWPRRRLRAGMPRGDVRHFATSDEAADAAVGAGEGRRPRAREGIARREDGSRRRTAEGGARLMLYHLLYPFHTAALGAERDALHHVPHRGGEPVGAGDQPRARPVADPQAARVPDRAGDPHRRADRRIGPRRARRRWAGC